ncbi:MAG: AarF/UbiB family protein [Gammaproteobacteria bacterium]
MRNSRDDADRLLAKRALANLFADARGVTMKVGQLFAGNSDDTPFQALVESIEPLPLRIMRPVLEADLGKPVSQVFQSLDEAAAAASLGQVHHAVLAGDGEVAVKIRYPDIADAVDAELRIAGMVPGAGPVKRWGFNLEAYRNTLRGNMLRELDYRSEAERQKRFAQAVQVPGLRVPEVFDALCGQRVLVQSWESGVRLAEAANWSKKDRLLIGRTLLLTLFKSLFVAGEVHGDPHPGNYLFRHDPPGQPLVVLLDFGCTVTVAEPRRLALLKLILACREGAELAPLNGFAAMGFDADKLSYIADALPALCRSLFRPFLLERPFDVGEWRVGEDIAALLGEQRWWFRSAGPADLFLLMRAFQGVAAQLQTLDVRLPWWPLLEQAVGETIIAQARRLESSADGSPVSSTLKPLANSLRVRVSEGAETRVALTMPALAALDLENLMPEEVLERIRSSRQVDMRAIAKRILASGVAPQELFTFQDGVKHYRVWLE